MSNLFLSIKLQFVVTIYPPLKNERKPINKNFHRVFRDS